MHMIHDFYVQNNYYDDFNNQRVRTCYSCAHFATCARSLLCSPVCVCVCWEGGGGGGGCKEFTNEISIVLLYYLCSYMYNT